MPQKVLHNFKAENRPTPRNCLNLYNSNTLLYKKWGMKSIEIMPHLMSMRVMWILCGFAVHPSF